MLARGQTQYGGYGVIQDLWPVSILLHLNKGVALHSNISYFKNAIAEKKIELLHVCTDYEVGKKFGCSGEIIGKVTDQHSYNFELAQSGTTIFRQEDGLHCSDSNFSNLSDKHKTTEMYKEFNKELKTLLELIYLKD